MPDANQGVDLTKFDRKVCLATKDQYFQCVRDKIKDDKKTDAGCAEARALFNQKCLPSWVKHFEFQQFGTAPEGNPGST